MEKESPEETLFALETLAFLLLFLFLCLAILCLIIGIALSFGDWGNWEIIHSAFRKLSASNLMNNNDFLALSTVFLICFLYLFFSIFNIVIFLDDCDYGIIVSYLITIILFGPPVLIILVAFKIIDI